MSGVSTSAFLDLDPEVSDQFIEGGTSSVLELRDEMSALFARRAEKSRTASDPPTTARASMFPLIPGDVPMPPSTVLGPTTPLSRPRSVASEKDDAGARGSVRREIVELSTKTRQLEAAVEALNRSTAATGQLTADAAAQAGRDRSEARQSGAALGASVNALVDRVANLEDLLGLLIREVRRLAEASGGRPAVTSEDYEAAERGDGPIASAVRIDDVSAPLPSAASARPIPAAALRVHSTGPSGIEPPKNAGGKKY